MLSPAPVEIDAEFHPRLQCLFRPKRYKVLWGGRGAGRSWGIARALLILGYQRQIRVLCARELQNSIEESVHKVLSDQVDLLHLGHFYTIEKKKIYGQNGTTFSFEGIKNNTRKIKSYEGIDYCWVEEAVAVTRASWDILIPTIRKSGSEIWMSFNPELETDYTYKEFVKHQGASSGGTIENDDTVVVKMTYADNPWFGGELRKEMEKLKEADYDRYLNVWEGYTLQHLEGAVYAKELRKAQEENRICAVPYDRETPVDTWWDLGRADKTAIWFTQRVAMQYRILAYFEDSMEDITYYLRECQLRGYLYGTFNLPHDAKAKKLVTKHSIEEIVRRAGYRVNIVPKLSLTDGINAVRLVFPNCYFDEDKCEEGLNALRHYRYSLKPQKGQEAEQLANEPLHDWASDGADAFRYFAIGIKRPSAPVSEITSRLKRVVSKYVEQTPGLGWMA